MAGSEAPDALSHVRHFMSTIDDLERFARLYPIPTSTNVVTGHGDDDHARWVVITHALLLRKYFAPRDKLLLTRVAQSLQACSEGDHGMTSEDWVLLQENVAKIATNTTVIVGPDGVKHTEHDVLTNELYGRYLHGDYDKWLGTQRIKQPHADSMIMTATLSRLWRVQKFVEYVRVGIDKGYLDLDG